MARTQTGRATRAASARTTFIPVLAIPLSPAVAIFALRALEGAA